MQFYKIKKSERYLISMVKKDSTLAEEAHLALTSVVIWVGACVWAILVVLAQAFLQAFHSEKLMTFSEGRLEERIPLRTFSVIMMMTFSETDLGVQLRIVKKVVSKFSAIHLASEDLEADLAQVLMMIFSILDLAVWVVDSVVASNHLHFLLLLVEEHRDKVLRPQQLCKMENG